jgi:hypothetical protein
MQVVDMQAASVMQLHRPALLVYAAEATTCSAKTLVCSCAPAVGCAPSPPFPCVRPHLYRMQEKSVWRPSSRLMSSLEKVRPGMRPRFLSQKMAQKLHGGEGGGGVDRGRNQGRETVSQQLVGCWEEDCDVAWQQQHGAAATDCTGQAWQPAAACEVLELMLGNPVVHPLPVLLTEAPAMPQQGFLVPALLLQGQCSCCQHTCRRRRCPPPLRTPPGAHQNPQRCECEGAAAAAAAAAAAQQGDGYTAMDRA